MTAASSIREEYPEVSDCVDKISSYYQNGWSIQLTEEEKPCLIMHVKRVCSQPCSQETI